MEKLSKTDGQSMDIVESNITQLKEIFPEVFAEGKIDFDKLQALLGSYVKTEEDHYNFTWHGKRRAARLAQTPSTGTLRPCKEESVDWDTTQNLFIEGDNLEVLKLLQKSYHRQVKMIYIDPPYNTGNDFVYEDDFKDGVKHYLEMTGQLDGDGKKISTNSSSAGRYHTNWLNMMYPRLKLARNLLRDDGVIFISIDDNENANLKKLCDEVFGEENFISTITWLKKRKGSFLSKTKVSLTEYCLIYGKTNGIKLTGGKADISESQPLIKRTNSTGQLKIPASIVETKLPDGRYKIGTYGDGTSSVKLLKEIEVKDGIIVSPLFLEGPFIWSQKYLEEQLANGAKLVINTISFQVRAFKSSNFENHKGFPTFINGIEIKGTNEDGYEELERILGKEALLDYPKPTAYLNQFIKASFDIEPEGIFMDFFAGSGSSAHSIMKYNLSTPNANLKYILVQLPEAVSLGTNAFTAGYKAISEITKERIRRAANKIKEENPLFAGDLGFKVFKLDTSNIKPWDAGFETLENDLIGAVDYIKQDRSNEDVLYELLLKYGLDLTVPIETRNIGGKTIYSIGIGALIVCLDKEVSMETVEGIGKLKEELSPEIMRVVFKDNGFKDDVVKTNAIQTLKRFGIEDIKSL